MQLTQFTDYALRVLIHLAVNEGDRVALPRITAAFGISHNHLVKVVQNLVANGLILSHRGRGGGLELARPAEEITVGQVIRATEPRLDLIECFDQTSEICVIAPACRLKTVLVGAMNGFMAELDGVSLAAIARPRTTLRRLLEPS